MRAKDLIAKLQELPEDALIVSSGIMTVDPVTDLILYPKEYWNSDAPSWLKAEDVWEIV